jgi:putative membrane protein
VSTGQAASQRAAAPVAGANSFTEAEARSRIEARGYSNVTGLQKDGQSIWRGTALKNGQTVGVALDYQGKVVAQ